MKIIIDYRKTLQQGLHLSMLEYVYIVYSGPYHKSFGRSFKLRVHYIILTQKSMVIKMEATDHGAFMWYLAYYVTRRNCTYAVKPNIFFLLSALIEGSFLTEAKVSPYTMSVILGHLFCFSKRFSVQR